MDNSSSDSCEQETSRIRAAYARRESRGRYTYFNPGNLFQLQQLQRRTLDRLKQLDLQTLETLKILDVGCGGGGWIRNFIEWGALPENVAGIDLLPDRVAKAKRLCPGGVELHSGDASRLEFPEGEFDLLIVAMVFSSVLDMAMKQQIAREMLRALKSDGVIIWYDFYLNNPRNPDVRGIKKRELRALFSDCDIRLRRITLAPPIARKLAPYSWVLCHLLEMFPLLCTHYLGTIRKKAT